MLVNTVCRLGLMNISLFAYIISREHCESCPNAEYELWKDMQDIVGSASFWPRSIQKYFWTAYLLHFQRVLTATFVWVNGLNPEVYYD